MAFEPIPDEDYASADDSDFAPDENGDAPEHDSSQDSDDDVPDTRAPAGSPGASRKRPKGAVDEAEDAGFENSGDEAIIEKGAKRRKRAKHTEDDEGGEGGVIKTRSQRAQE